MIPKNTATLKPGDFCAIPRPDGKVVLFAYLRPVPNKRSAFYGGLLAPALPASALSNLPAKLTVESFALVHINCFAENQTPIIGNAARAIGESAFSAVSNAVGDSSVGAKHAVWGHLTIMRRAAGIGA